ncbi:unnamed protein product [Discosporangium mesarthrocarpum]
MPTLMHFMPSVGRRTRCPASNGSPIKTRSSTTLSRRLTRSTSTPSKLSRPPETLDISSRGDVSKNGRARRDGFKAVTAKKLVLVDGGRLSNEGRNSSEGEPKTNEDVNGDSECEVSNGVGFDEWDALGSASTRPSDVPAYELSEYELKRSENIRRNQAMMATLGLADRSTNPLRNHALQMATRKGLRGTKRSRPKNSVPLEDLRRSKRARSEAPQYTHEKITGMADREVRGMESRSVNSTIKGQRRISSSPEDTELPKDESEEEAEFWARMANTPCLHRSKKSDPAVSGKGNWGLIEEGKKKSFFGRVGTGEVKYSGSKVYYARYATTCHWCRQKTVDLKSRCAACAQERAFGVLCGPCLHNRYGEDLLDVHADKDWFCPSCTDDCNCSFCLPGMKKVSCTGQVVGRAADAGLSINQYLRKTKSVSFGMADAVHPELARRAKAVGQTVKEWLYAYHRTRGTLAGRRGDLDSS